MVIVNCVIIGIIRLTSQLSGEICVVMVFGDNSLLYLLEFRILNVCALFIGRILIVFLGNAAVTYLIMATAELVGALEILGAAHDVLASLIDEIDATELLKLLVIVVRTSVIHKMEIVLLVVAGDGEEEVVEISSVIIRVVTYILAVALGYRVP